MPVHDAGCTMAWQGTEGGEREEGHIGRTLVQCSRVAPVSKRVYTYTRETALYPRPCIWMRTRCIAFVYTVGAIPACVRAPTPTPPIALCLFSQNNAPATEGVSVEYSRR